MVKKKEEDSSRGFMAASAAVAVPAVLLLLTTTLPPAFGSSAAPAAASQLVPRGRPCTRSCGNISIPYPFGIEPTCYHAAAGVFHLTCNHSYRPPRLLLGVGGTAVQVLEISIPNATVRVRSNLRSTDGGENRTWVVGFPQRSDSPYMSMSSDALDGSMYCEYSGLADQEKKKNGSLASCTAARVISSPDGFPATGYSFNSYSIDVGYSFYSVEIRKLRAALVSGTFGVDDMGRYYDELKPELVTLIWVISPADSLCVEPVNNVSAPECRSSNSACVPYQDPVLISGYSCRCSDGYHGNPYVDDGPLACQDINECASPELYSCYGDCKNTPGSFICTCPAGYMGNSSVPNGCKDINECDNPKEHSCYGTCQNFPGSFHCQCPNGTCGNPYTKDGCVVIKRKNSVIGLIIALGVGSGTSLLLALVAPFVARKIKRQKVKRTPAWAPHVQLCAIS